MYMYTFCNHSNPDTYWATTGLFPQEVVITLPSLTNLTGVTIKSTNGKYTVCP